MSEPTTRRRLAALMVAAAAGGTVLVGTAAPASAVTAASTSAAGVSPVAAVAVATCPAGTSLVGTGGQINNGNGNVVMTDVIPNVATGTVTVWGHENGAYPLNWSVTAIAICEPVAVVQVAAASAVNGAATKTLAVACPGATQLTGVGYQLNNGNGQVFPQLVQPAPGLGGATVSATEVAGYAPPWQLTAYALCASPAGFAPQRLAAQNGPNSVSPKQAITGACPPGTDLFGTGADLSFTNANVVLDQMVPDPGQTTTTSRGDEAGAFAGNWSAFAYAICW
jgi:hypothetical protein